MYCSLQWTCSHTHTHTYIHITVMTSSKQCFTYSSYNWSTNFASVLHLITLKWLFFAPSYFVLLLQQLLTAAVMVASYSDDGSCHDQMRPSCIWYQENTHPFTWQNWCMWFNLKWQWVTTDTSRIDILNCLALELCYCCKH